MYLGLSTWSKVLFQKLAVSHLLKKFSTFYGTKTKTHNFFHPQPDQSDPQPLILLFRSHFNIIIPLRLFFQVTFFLQVSSPKPCIFLASPHVQKSPAHVIPLDLITRMISGEKCRSWNFSSYNYSHFGVTSFLLVTNIFFNTLFPNTLDLCCSLNVRVSHTRIKQLATCYFCLS